MIVQEGSINLGYQTTKKILINNTIIKNLNNIDKFYENKNSKKLVI